MIGKSGSRRLPYPPRMTPWPACRSYWTDASAMLPKGGHWELRGVVKGPRKTDPAI